MRRFLTFIGVAIATAAFSLNWLHNGDWEKAVEPVIAEWDAELLARNAGLDDTEADRAPAADGLQEEPSTP